MTRLWGVFLVFLLTGCAQDALDLCCEKSVALGNRENVTILHTWNAMDARTMAENHCKKHARTAVYNEAKTRSLPANQGLFVPTRRYVFDCVE